MNPSRRAFTKLLLGAVPAAGLLSSLPSLRAAATATPGARPNSKVNGVQIGLNVPYSFGNNAMDPDEVLAKCVQLGISALELRTQPVEIFLGVPASPPRPRGAVVDPAAAKASAEKLRDARLSAPAERIQAFRKKYEDAGVFIEIVKVDGLFGLEDAVLDYTFRLAKGLGARALSAEISNKEEDLRRLGTFADKHQLMVGYHGHASTTPAHWEKAFSFAKYNGANVDLGHFVAGNHGSPVEFIRKHHARITHVHVKDRKSNGGPNVPFGEGDTPLVEVLRLIRDNRWNIQATIEFEYPVPAGSTRMAEIARTVTFCRDALA